MESPILYFILCITLCVFNVDLMAIKGPAITRYDPCGLALIHFDQITKNVWQGVLHLGFYQNHFSPLEIEISFEKQMVLHGASQNSTFSVRNNGHDFIIKPVGIIPNKYIFYLSVNEESDNNVPIVNKLILNKQTLCNESIKASQTVNKFNVTKEHDTKYHHVCGRRALDNAELTSVRTDAKAGDWPWHVALFIKNIDLNTDYYECGGNIVSTTAVLTAGHCVTINDILIDSRRLKVLAGISNLKDSKQIGRQVQNAERIILHPAYNVTQATADLAIVKVKYFRFTEYVQPVCIWGPVYDKSSLFGKEAMVVGFGRKEDNKLSDTLRSAYIMVQNDTTCIAYSPKLYESLLNEFTFCAGFGPTSGINPRNGDSGGGLVVPTVQPDHKISWFLRGIVSKCGISPGHTECDPKFYLVYTDVGPHYGWIYHNAGLEYRSNVLYN
ncbi:unnamed protein product [Parnassius mnemosyne]|uniref:Peptidase S1 domain-containing protein n=1 Tax=Parnassius mnemosyne TaxID=213953 RepID=A0AAV1LZH7_9NEOP